LYRHTPSGRYYGCKKVLGRRKERSLGTTDRKIAERRLKEWIANLGKVDTEVEKTTLKDLNKRFIAVSQGKSDSTLGIITSITEEFENWWPYGADPEVRNIRPSHIEEWLALHERRLKNTSYNRYAGVLKQVFEMAVNDRIIAESPFDRVRTRWKKPQTPVRRVPTLEQFQAIVASVRAEKRSHGAKESADFIEFLGLAGVGQAEASSLTWGDVDFAKGQMSFRRHKTDRLFTVPIYPHLRPLLERLRQEAEEGKSAQPKMRVLKIDNARKSLAGACVRLRLPHFSQRNLRQCLIMRLWKSGVDKKLIAKWQGHQDGGQLILDTYTEVFGSDDEAYEAQQLAKLEVVTAPAKPPAEVGTGVAQPVEQVTAA
jgi:integrase